LRPRREIDASDFVDASEISDILTGMAEVDVFSALANPVRREILMQLRKGPRAVNDLAQRFEVGRPAVSEHLQVLRKARLVREEPRGRERFYHLNPRPLSEVEVWLSAFGHYWKKRLAMLEDVIEKEKKGEP
jgi:DNA-binding transcriptional ArsR family regulator